jgi:tetratricopeptide (TPR) repeat protein
MRTYKKFFYAFLISACIAPNLAAQTKEIPVTTSSKEALDLFLAGRDKFENLVTTTASTLFDKAIEKDPNFALAYLYRAQSGGGFNVFRKNLDKAISLSDKASDGEKLVISYYQAFADGNGGKQKESLDKLLSTFPSDKRVQAIAGEYYYGINDFQQALTYFKKASDIDKNFAPVYNMIGYCEAGLNNYPEAESAFQTYIKLIPNNPNPYDSYGELLLKMGKYDESIEQYKKALDKDPAFSTSLAGIGNNYVFKGDFETARKYFQGYYDKSTAINGKLDALYQKAVSYIYEGKHEDAVKAFDDFRALAEKENLVPSAINSYASQGFIATEGGNPKEGREYFEKATDLIAKSNLPTATKENFSMNSIFWKFYYLTANNELDKAQAAADECKAKVESRKNPNEEMFFNTLLGIFEVKKGDFDKAISSFSKGDQEDPLTWYYNAVAYSKNGDKENSAKLFSKISKWNISSMNLAFVRKNAAEELNNNIASNKTK